MASLYGIANKKSIPNLAKNAQPKRKNRFGLQVLLYNYANQRSAAFVYDARERLLEFCLRVDGHLPELCDNAFARNIVERFSEDVRFPDAARIPLEALQKEVDDLLRGFFPAERGADLGFNVCHNHMNGRRGGLEPHAVAPALPDDLRLFELEFIRRRYDDPVPVLANVL